MKAYYRWLAEIRSGTRTLTQHDPLSQAACCDLNARDAVRDGLPLAAADWARKSNAYLAGQTIEEPADAKPVRSRREMLTVREGRALGKSVSRETREAWGVAADWEAAVGFLIDNRVMNEKHRLRLTSSEPGGRVLSGDLDQEDSQPE